MYILGMRDKKGDRVLSVKQGTCNLLLQAYRMDPGFDGVYPLRVTGKTYHERKTSARDIAIDLQAMQGMSTMSMYEYSELYSYLYSIGKQYGLLKEFRDNGVI